MFRRATREYIYYCTITDEMDNVEVIDRNRQYIHNHLLEGLRQSTDIMAYKQAGFIFVYECKSDQNPDLTLYHDSFGPDDYREPKPENDSCINNKKRTPNHQRSLFRFRYQGLRVRIPSLPEP